MSRTRVLAAFATTALATALALPPGIPALAGAAHRGIQVGSGIDRATIVRDGYGVPTVFGTTMRGMWLGDGYAQAQDRLVQLELVKRSVEGTLSEIFGPGQLGQDETIRTFFYTPKEVAAQLAAMPASTRRVLQSYGDGINAFLAKAYRSAKNERTMVPYEFFVLGKLLGLPGPYRPADWTPADTVAVGNFLAREFGGGGGAELDNLAFLDYLQAWFTSQGDPNAKADALASFNDARWIDDPTAPTTVPSGSGSATELPAPALPVDRALPAFLSRLPLHDVLGGAKALRDAKAQLQRTGETLEVPWKDGSNSWVVAPPLSADGHALLWGGPQEGFGSPSVDGEVNLHGPGYYAAGMYITGEPYILIGHNANAAWTTTSEELVDQQIYLEQVDFSTDPPSYLYRGTWRPMRSIDEHIAVAGDGRVKFRVLRTVHGPVFYADPSNGIAFSMRFASWKQETGSLLGFSELGGDQTVASFAASMAKLTTLHNFLFADRQGDIAYFGNGLLPILPTCQTCDPRLPHLGDGSQEWQGFEPFDRMPHSVDPAQGYLVNWNTKPDQQHYYQQNGGDEYWGTIYRSDRIAQDIVADGSKNTLASTLRIERDIGTIDGDDTLRPAAPEFLPYLFGAYEALLKAKDPLVDPKTHPLLAPSIDALEGWNRTTSLGSNAMYLFVEWMEAFQRNLFGGGLNPGEQYMGAVNFADGGLGMGTYLGDATYNLEDHILAGTGGIVPCGTLCYPNDYFAGQRDHILVESLNDAIALLSGTGPLLGNGGATGFGNTNVKTWRWEPWHDLNWDQLDPLAVGIVTDFGTSPSQERSTYMQALDLGVTVAGVNVLPPGQSGFISADGTVSPHFGDQVPLFNAFAYKPMG